MFHRTKRALIVVLGKFLGGTKTVKYQLYQLFWMSVTLQTPGVEVCWIILSQSACASTLIMCSLCCLLIAGLVVVSDSDMCDFSQSHPQEEFTVSAGSVGQPRERASPGTRARCVRQVCMSKYSMCVGSESFGEEAIDPSLLVQQMDALQVSEDQE